MALTIYGSPRSRTMRTLWVAAELDLEYEHVPLAWDDAELQTPAFRAISPMGAIPAIVDDGFALSESLAINLYLAKRYGGSGRSPLYPQDPQGEAEVWRWSLWAQGQLEPWVQQDTRLAALREAAGDAGRAEAQRALFRLDDVLAGQAWLADKHFTVGDLNVAAILSPSRTSRLDLQPHLAVRDWLSRCYARPAARATRLRYSA